MPPLPPPIQTYHCLCTSLLLASTHTLSNLPRRSTTSGSLDAAIILPLPSGAPDLNNAGTSEGLELPEEGYTLLLGIAPDKKVTVMRREDGFEKRVLYRCSRCRLVVGYELQTQTQIQGDGMDLDKGKGRDGYDGKVIYLLPAGIMSTGVMMGGEGKKVGEEDVEIGGVAVFE
jgi:hypothetical protein